MDTSLERIQAKIAELEAKIVDLRIAERELQALDKVSARPTRATPSPRAKQKPGPKPKRKPEPSDRTEARQTIGAAITGVLDQHGALSAAEIAEHVKAAGRDVNNRTISFTVQALKKRGLARNTDGKWTPQGRGRRTRSSTGASAQKVETAA